MILGCHFAFWLRAECVYVFVRCVWTLSSSVSQSYRVLKRSHSWSGPISWWWLVPLMVVGVVKGAEQYSIEVKGWFHIFALIYSQFIHFRVGLFWANHFLLYSFHTPALSSNWYNIKHYIILLYFPILYFFISSSLLFVHIYIFFKYNFIIWTNSYCCVKLNKLLLYLFPSLWSTLPQPSRSNRPPSQSVRLTLFKVLAAFVVLSCLWIQSKVDLPWTRINPWQIQFTAAECNCDDYEWWCCAERQK